MGQAIINGSVMGESKLGGVGEPLIGATVTAKNTKTNATFTVTTDSVGEFDFDSQPMSYGTYDLTATMSGYAGGTMTVTVSESLSVDGAVFLLLENTPSSSSKPGGLAL